MQSSFVWKWPALAASGLFACRRDIGGLQNNIHMRSKRSATGRSHRI